jgi:dipeptidyl aminopeptidase/acylaminoacyl peptidase
MQGALFYPANYQQGVRYPMVVHIYERRSQNLHDYINPNVFGFNESAAYANPAVLTTNGYFLLQPDIAYRLNEPGMSALECVTAAVERVTETGIVDRNKVGLFGFSYGGYETSFIVTKTDLFAAAVAGAAPTDMVSSYLSIAWFTGEPHFESSGSRLSQMRFNGSYYEHPDAYLRNSPVHNAGTIKTPLLMFFGESDENVDWRQGIELHLAMRRMQKQNVFLVYPGEDHQIMKRENVADLHRRVLDWFGHYLKGEEAAEWIVNEDQH